MLDRYDWKRYWCPTNGRIILSDSGYLSDPDGPHGSEINPDVLSFEAFAGAHCLILMGEPGIGKSTEIEEQFRGTQGRVKLDGNEALFFNLRNYQTTTLLRDEIFGHPQFQSWIVQTNHLYLYLDSLDEGLLSANTLATWLSAELQKYPVGRLYLRVACRTAEWPKILEAGLRKLWSEEQVTVVELAPLRRKDVYQAAQTSGLDPEAFLDAVRQRDAVPLAIRPITLDFLLKTFRKRQQLPATKAELYDRSCLLLCEEQNPSRLASGGRPVLSSGQLLAVSSRIAAVTIFCNRTAIWTGTPITDAPEGDTILRELVGGTERADGNSFIIGEEQIRQALATGLFTARGPQRLGWAHQTFAEYLTAYYLNGRDLSLDQKMGLLIYPGDREGRIITQLHETAAWLAGMDREIFKRIADADPQVLLLGDVANADQADRVRLVENLLRHFDEERLIDYDFDLHERYRNLSHSGLAEQLRSYITDRTKNAMLRRVAIDIAEACIVSALQNDLAAVALDDTEVIGTRVNAAYAIVKIGDKEARETLMPLARGQAGPDPDDELKGCGFRAVWPDSLRAQELFSLLSTPRRESFYGAYAGFLSQDLVSHLSSEDLPLALEWVRENVAAHDELSYFGRLASKIINKAWEHLGVPEVAAALARTLIFRLRHSDDDLSEAASRDDNKRRQLLDIIIPELVAVKDRIIWLADSKTPLAQSDDLYWLIERLRREPSPEVRECLVELIHGVFKFRIPGHLDAIIEAAGTEALIAEKFSWHLTPVDLDSPEARQQRELYQKHRETERPHQKTPDEDPSPTEQISMLLDRFEVGDIDAWWQLNWIMAIDPETRRLNEYEPDLVKMPGWKIVDDLIKSRITRGALQYLLNGDPDTEQWLGLNITYRPAFAGYRALFLFVNLQPDIIAKLPPEVWQRWAPIVLAYPIAINKATEQSHFTLVELAYQNAKEQMLETLTRLIDKENTEFGDLAVLRRFEKCWNDDLTGMLLAKVTDPQLRPSIIGQILGALIDFGSNEARKYAERLVNTRLQETEREKAKAAARVLFRKAAAPSWPVLWRALEEDPSFGKEVIASSVHDFRSNVDVVWQLPEEDIASLYIWLVQQYSYEEDPARDGVYTIGPDDNARRFRDAVLRTLKERGSVAAIIALKRVAESLPQYDWLRWSVIEAQNQARRTTWEPLLPQTLLELVQDRDKRLVQSGEQLLSILIESLQRLESKLQGETPAAIDLWNQLNKINKTTFWPKDENDFTNYVKRHFDEDLKGRGIIVNREVEIRRSMGGAQGERTDIQVDAVLFGGNGRDHDTITVIIEVKGCWHNELMTAMGTQLKDRYLNDNQCRHGLYLIGWFNCDQWDRNDRRFRKVQRLQKIELERILEGQAAFLSNDEVLLRPFVINAALRPVR
jgi:hypothetical protein